MGAPMLKDGVAVGAILVGWPDAGHTPARQVELIKTFADQAVIAVENVRLLNETKESLERQTATAEILKVIASSPRRRAAGVRRDRRAARTVSSAGTRPRSGAFRDQAMHLVGFTPTTREGDAALRQLSGTALVSFELGQRVGSHGETASASPIPRTKPSRGQLAREVARRAAVAAWCSPR